ncbi:ATP-dependent (S)-NAD(P)H-hydrate dehydratase [Micractinium conductrix]|uniref:ATP-dependent (S)-NAD(P)H-hydrate dehydratase n=1 Tax=Micractinium conductrix TaxID=554055 RepID=A0A2P6V9B9_9CHLO|nr:ATP-dependent (S)-NAD(P)H-hydrate dehydratase [Micractinium conductrix]|eukprot:PSC70682.1 ATP-dependent (S)-NAD(P)H-hydrate dehydratase [Micractinium conductrix]
MASSLAQELRSIQKLLLTSGGTVAAATAASPLPRRRPPTQQTSSSDVESDSEEAPVVTKRRPRKIASAPKQSSQEVLDLERTVAALREQAAGADDRAARLQEALDAARQDGAVVGQRLRAELDVKAEETGQLAELVMSLREEADGLRAQLQAATAAAQQCGKSSAASVAQLQAAAAEWRRRGEDTLEALAEERTRSAALQTQAAQLRAENATLQRALVEEREHARRAFAAAATAAATVGSPGALVADLRARLAQERAWRKAVSRWLQGEMATRSDLEWVLLNVGSAVRGPPPPPPIPPRRMAASQLAPQRPPGSPTAVRVTLHSPAAGQTLSVGVDGDGGCTVHRYGPIGGACGTCAGGSQPAVGGAADGGERRAAAATMADDVPAGPSLQELLRQVARLVPDLAPDKYKGQAGKVAVIGGCREYTGAPFFASMAALKIGADLSHVFCSDGAATVIKGYSPELIVHPYLPESWQAAQQGGGGGNGGSGGAEAAAREAREQRARAAAVAAIEPWLDRFDAVVVGPGLGRDPLTLATVAEVMRAVRRRSLPMVVDADGLWLVNQDPSLVKGYANAVLTPNKVEFQRLAGVLGVDVHSPEALQRICQSLEGPVVVRKGAGDAVGDGRRVVVCQEEGSPRRAGGQGDVLSGCIAAYAAWAQRAAGASREELHDGGGGGGGPALPPLVLAAYAGCITTRRASRRAFVRQRRSMGAGDLLVELGAVVDEIAATAQA